MDARFRFVAGFLLAFNALMILILCGVVMDTREDVRGLEGVLVTKQELANVAAPRLTLFHEDKCTGCHSERRFAGPHGPMPGQIDQVVAQMGAMRDAHFTDQDVAKIHGSLTVMRCAQCHGTDKLRLLAIKTPEERMQIIREMIAKPGSKISPDEAEAILRSYEELIGF